MVKPLLILIIFLLMSCSAMDRRPDWIDQPGEGAVGYSGTHVDGRHAQEALAIARARERLAARRGVVVSSDLSVNERLRNERGTVRSDKSINVSVDQQSIRSRLQESWYDRETDTLWVWVVPE